MENDELQKIWKHIDTEISQRSTDELNVLLTSKARQTINKFLFINGTSILICIGFLFFLIVAALNRQTDTIYLVNNLTLATVTTVSLFIGLNLWYQLQNNGYNQPLKSWLDARIKLLSKWLTGKYSSLYLYIIPILYILTVLSIHVYFENKHFMDVLQTEESLFGLIVGTPIGMFVAFYGAIKIRRYQLRKLEFLKDLYARLCNMG
jgi:hypothetical protein